VGLRPPPSSPDRQRCFPDLRKSPPFQWLGWTKRGLRSGFLSCAPAERLKLSASLWRQNPVSQIDGCHPSKGSAIRQVSSGLCHVNLNWPREVSTTQFEFMQLSRPEPELGLPIFARPKFGSRDNALIPNAGACRSSGPVPPRTSKPDRWHPRNRRLLHVGSR
jgi:hypothetical protein